MSRKPRKGYFVRGQFVAEGSELDEEFKRELRGDGPSKTELKAQSAELQALGEALLGLRADLFEPLELPSRLLDALDELRRIGDFEGRRRQGQFVGKLMRQLDDAQIDAIRAALDEQRKGSARDTLRLHAAENWRGRLIDDDAAVSAWVTQFPDTDVQQLRALVAPGAGAAPPPRREKQARAGRAPGPCLRELFQLINAALERAEAQAPEVQPIDAEDVGYRDDGRAG